MSALELLKARQAELKAQADAKKAKDEIWKKEQMQQLEPIKIAMRELASAEPPLMVCGHEFREEKLGRLHISDTSIVFYLDSSHSVSYDQPCQEFPTTHFLVRSNDRYGMKPQRFTNPIDAIDCIVGLIAKHQR